jgi:hypothetical protein
MSFLEDAKAKAIAKAKTEATGLGPGEQIVNTGPGEFYMPQRPIETPRSKGWGNPQGLAENVGRVDSIAAMIEAGEITPEEGMLMRLERQQYNEAYPGVR